MKNVEKYTKQFFAPPKNSMSWTKINYIKKAPIWCSVDLRDGNQSLIVPMSLEQKLDFFKFLVKLGFKEIEIGFPAASETEYNFCRELIERQLIPNGVTIQVLTQAREHIIAKTFEALEGTENAIIHLYNSTSIAQREQVFKRSKPEIIEIAKNGAEICEEYRAKTKGNFRFEYSPESFTGTEPEFALEICNEVINIWKPVPNRKVIINLPATVSLSMPHIYANQIEYMCENLNCRENVIISLHPHNDRGCAVADSEMGLIAGADRIEGTLFGNGERTGNADIITLAMNMYSQGVDPELNFENIPEIVRMYEEFTDMNVHDRHPYSGSLVFAAFSGSHQDAIAKGMKWREEHDCKHWTVPYLPIDPNDVGRKYESDVIRVNSQSGKGGIGYVLEKQYGFNLPAKMREHFGYTVKNISDRSHKEVMTEEVYQIFMDSYVNIEAPLKLLNTSYSKEDNLIKVTAVIEFGGEKKDIYAYGNGRLDSLSNALNNDLGLDYKFSGYSEHALEDESNARAAAYINIKTKDGIVFWGAGIDNDIIAASGKAIVSAINNSLSK